MSGLQPVRFGKYLILNKIAIGGMAELFQAKITSVAGFEKLIAIKKILPHLTQDKTLVDMFIDEAKLAAMLTHQNIVQIYDLGSMEGTYYIAMEYIHGKDLRTIINKSQEKGLALPIEHALYITCRICAGLDYSHNFKDFQGNFLKLIHRDISPQNILVTYEGEVKIVDFGIAKAARQSVDTKVGMIKGKAAYMSPEQASGKTIDHRSDIFSTGIVTYEMITGKRMFEGPDLQVLKQVRKVYFEPLEKIRSDLPPKVYEVLHRALARDPGSRYQSCAEMLSELEQCLAEHFVRPSAELLAQYMKNLFADEIAAEVDALKEKENQISPLNQQIAPKESTRTQEDVMEVLPVSDKKPVTAHARQRVWLGAWAVGMAVIAMLLALLFQNNPAPTSGKDKLAASPSSTRAPRLREAAPASAASPSAKEATASGPHVSRSPNGSTERAAPRLTKMDKAFVALKSKDFVRAAELFEEVIVGKPKELTMIAGPYAQALRGWAAGIMSENPPKAKVLLHKAIEVDPQNAEAHFYLGKIYTTSKDYPMAIDAYRKAIDLDPHSPDAFFNLGFAYTVTKDYAKAEDMFAKVIALSPAYQDEAYFNLAMVQRRQGKKQESIRNLEKAVAINPKNIRAKKYLLLFKSGTGEVQ